MSVKAKSRKRLVILLAAAVGVVGLAGGAWVYHLHRQKAWVAEERELGMQAAAANDAPGAVRHLALWLSRNPDDIEVLPVYAKQRLAMETQDGSNVLDAINRLRRLAELRPAAEEPRRQLMQLYARYGFTTEAQNMADWVLAKNPSDPEALKYKLGALMRLRKWDEALAAAETWAALDRSDPEPQLRVLGLMAQLNRPANEIVAKAKKVEEKDPNSPVAQLVLGWAYALSNDLPTAQKLMRQVAAVKPPTPAFARLLVDQLNRVGLYDDSLQLLQRLVKESDDVELRRTLVRRAWEMNRAADVIGLTQQDAAKLGDEAIAFRAIAFVQLGKRDEAKQALATLPTGKQDALADAWSAVVAQQMDPSSVQPRDLLKLCQKALLKDSEGGYLRYFMGQAYAQLDEGDLAIEAWQQVASQNPTWSLPLIRLSDLRLSKGRTAMAMQAAQEAIRRSPGSALAAINLAKVWSASAEGGHVEQPEKLLQLIGDIRKQLPQEETTLSMQASLLGSMGKKDEAATAIKAALAAKDAPSEQTLLRLAAISRAYDLGTADACFDRSEQAHGVTANLAYARAVHKLSQGAAADGLELLKTAKEKASKPGDVEWDLAWARYLELTNNPEAKEAWVKLADANPANRQVQQMALGVRSARADRDFVDRTIERLRKLTGDEGVTWKLARARWILEGAKTDQELAQATVLLKDVIRAAEDLAEPHVLLAQAYERLSNANGAIEQLRAAAAIDPSNSQVALYLSRLLQKRGEFDKAREELARVANGKGTDVQQKRQAAVLLAQQGDSQRAIELLQGADDDKQGGGANGLLLAMLYRQRNEMDKAEQIARKLLAESPEPVVVQFAADLYAQQGRRADADKALALLDGMKLKPGMKELLLADHATRYQGPDKAIEEFNASLKAAPDNATAWRALVGYYAYLGRGKEMAETADAGLKAVPGDAALKEVVARKDVLAASAGSAETRPLVVAYLSDARPDAPSLQAMRVIAEARQGGEGADQTLGKLRKVADAYPSFAQLQAILVQRYIQLNRADEAAQLASRGVQMFPNDPEPARLAVEAMSASQRWAEAMGFAKTWRERSLSNPLPADMAISKCQLQLGQLAAAADTIAAYIPAAVARPDQGGQIIYQYVAALTVAGKPDKAAEVLWPLTQGSAEWRKVWMQVGLLGNDATAAAWLGRIEPAVPADSQDERAVLAGAWHMLGTRAHDAGAIAKSNAMFDALMARPDVTPVTAMARGIAAEQDNDLPAAEAAYRKALALDPNSLVAMNNLAMVILKKGGDVSEAVKLAKAAVDKQPRTATLHDTLAQVQAKGKDYNGAAESLRRAVELEPNSPEWRVRLAQVLLDGGRPKDADKVVQEIATLPPGQAPLPEPLRKQLEQIRAELSKQLSASTQNP